MIRRHTYRITITRIRNAIQLILNGYFHVFLKELKHRMHGKTLSFGLKRDLKDNFKTPSARIDLTIRPLKNEDVPHLLENTSTHPVNPRIIANQQAMIEANIPTCYVAVTKNDKPCYMQWLISYKNTDKVKSLFKGLFPELKESEAMLEGAYNNPRYRGLRIMPAAMAEISKKAASLNARWVITFVDLENIASLKGCNRAGFKPYVLRKCEWSFFRYTVTFHPIPDELLAEYHRKIGGEKNNGLRKEFRKSNPVDQL